MGFNLRSVTALAALSVHISSTDTAAFTVPPRVVHRKLTTATTASSCRESTRLSSIPNAIDIFASGMASICRLPKGVTVVGTPPDEIMPKSITLWDVETNADCRVVREALTELDCVVNVIIPATENSRAVVEASSPYYAGSNLVLPRLALEDANGEQVILSGKDDIMAYLNNLKEQIPQSSRADNDMEEWKEIALSAWDGVGNALATALRWGRGNQVAPCAALKASMLEPPRPSQPLILYSYEGNQFCRLVREVMTELDLVYELRSAGKESPRRSELAAITGGSSQCPFLIDPNTGIDMAESKDIVEYLYKTYSRWTPPNELLQWTSQSVMPLIKPVFQAVAPLQAGSSQEDKSAYEQAMAVAKRQIEEDTQTNAVVVYTYELSPFCIEATDLLTRMGVDFKEVSLGKEWIPGLITPEGAQTRAALLEMTGQSSLPHVFIGAKSIGGLFSGSPGLVPALEQGRLDAMVESSSEMLTKRKSIALED